MTRGIVFAAGGAALFLALARAAVAWGGDLLPIPLWLATAAAIALGLVGGRTSWPAVFVGAGLVGNVVSGFWLFDETWRSLMVPAVSVAVEMVIAWFLLEPLMDLERGLRRTREAMRLVGLFVLIAVIGATIAAIDTSSAVIGGRVQAWERWALGEFVGLSVVIPLVLAFRSPWLVNMDLRHRLEAGAQTVIVLGLTVLSFTIEVSVLYLVIASMCWTGIRFGLRLSAPLATVVVVVATAASGAGNGPFFAGSIDPVVQAQIFNAAIAVCALVVAVHATRAWDDQQQLAATLRALPDAAAVRSRDGKVVSAWVPEALAHLEDALMLQSPPTTSTDPVTTAAPGTVVPSRLIQAGGHSLEHRISPIDDMSDLHLFRDVTEINRARRDIKLIRERLQRAEAAERRRLGQALHDGPIQELTAVQIRLELERSDLPPSLGDQRVATEKLLRSTIDGLRAASSSLTPPELGGRNLMAELYQIAKRFFDVSEVQFEVIDRLDSALDDDESNALFLVAREAVANIAFHAEATEALIELDHVGDAVQLRVVDDGVGVGDVAAVGGMHLGLQLMQERVDQVGGTLAIIGSPGVGTEVVIRLPAPRIDVGEGSSVVSDDA